MLLAFLSVVATWAQSEPWVRHTIELNSRNSVTIDAPSEEVWPRILKVDGWKQGASLVTVDGVLGEVGAVHKAVLGSDDALFYVQDVEIIPSRRRTMKLFMPNGGSLLGFAIYELEPLAEDRTKVSYHVYSESPVPDGLQGDADAVEELQMNSYEQNHARFLAELESLKELIEGGQP